MSLGLLVAPLLGGIVYDRAGYNAVFAMAYALIGLDIVLRLLLIEKKVAVRWDSSAGGRQAVGAVDASWETVTSNKTENQHSSADVEKMRPAAANQSNLQFTGSPSRRRDRLPPVVSLLGSRRLLASLFCTITWALLSTAFDSVLTIHVADVFGWSSTGAALLFLPMIVPTFIAPLFGWLSDRYGGRYFATIGFLLICPPLVCLRFVNENTITDKVLLCALLALTGLFLALTFPPIMAEISGIVETKEKTMLANGLPGFGVGGA